MKFADLKSEIVPVRQRLRELDGQFTREWQLTPRLLVRITVSVHDDGCPPQMSIGVKGVYSWMEGPDSIQTYVDRPIADLTMADARRVLAARAVVERWIAGEIDDLPTDHLIRLWLSRKESPMLNPSRHELLRYARDARNLTVIMLMAVACMLVTLFMDMMIPAEIFLTVQAVYLLGRMINRVVTVHELATDVFEQRERDQR